MAAGTTLDSYSALYFFTEAAVVQADEGYFPLPIRLPVRLSECASCADASASTTVPLFLESRS
jgi:hypothetical protein